ncbi:hypothetical protein KIN20_015323 [Parelaphostrongylus tenuis]|uniref:Uncharacterized protein n=1 Tax=Parelaphostrongylus tenuis TaxID=148309 RepID=A0AAD5MEQ2_PARTN|nr:hypothetical protein KIN20_015323 [Parelaphostrongylus tenuis]
MMGKDDMVVKIKFRAVRFIMKAMPAFVIYDRRAPMVGNGVTRISGTGKKASPMPRRKGSEFNACHKQRYDEKEEKKECEGEIEQHIATVEEKVRDVSVYQYKSRLGKTVRKIERGLRVHITNASISG